MNLFELNELINELRTNGSKVLINFFEEDGTFFIEILAYIGIEYYIPGDEVTFKKSYQITELQLTD